MQIQRLGAAGGRKRQAWFTAGGRVSNPLPQSLLVVPEPGGADWGPVEDALREKDAQLALCTFFAIRAVDQVVGLGAAKIAAYGAWIGLNAEGFAHQATGDGDGIGATQCQGNDGRGGHKPDQAIVEGAADMFGVVFGGGFLAHLHELHANELEALFFETGEDTADETPVKGIWLEQEESGLHGMGAVGGCCGPGE